MTTTTGVFWGPDGKLLQIRVCGTLGCGGTGDELAEELMLTSKRMEKELEKPEIGTFDHVAAEKNEFRSAGIYMARLRHPQAEARHRVRYC